MASSSDEGEIIENGVEDLKATSLQHAGRSSVDRQDRHKSRLSTPDHDSASRYSNNSRRSNSPRGFKRSHDDRERDRDRDHYSSRARDHDSRHFRVHYEDARRDDTRRPRGPYDDLDRPASRASNYSYDGRDRSRERDHYRDKDRDWYANKRPRNRSRSPQRSRRADRGRIDRFVREGHYDRRDDTSRGLKYDDDRSSRDSGSVSKRTTVGEASRAQGDDAKPVQGLSNGHGPSKTSQRYAPRPASVDGRPLTIGRPPVSQSEPERKPEPEPEPESYEEPEPVDEEAEIERRRKRREELMAKSSSATPLLLHAVGAAASKARAASPASTHPDTPVVHSEIASPRTPRFDLASPRSPGSHDEPSPGGINLLDDRALMNSHGKAQLDDEDGPSAADYDPTGDMQEDERRDELRHGHVVLHGEQHPIATTEQPQEEVQEEPAEKTGDDDDDDFDMFAEDFDEDKYATKPVEPVAPTAGDGVAPDFPAVTKGGILEGDDKDGYYKIRIGEVLNGRYQIQSALGRGMFSGVARAVDITTKQLVAIKMMRNNDALRKGGYTEVAILEKLNDADPENRKHIIKFERQFDYKGHLCMVFENLSMNLREVLRKFGNNVGINLGATRAYAYQIFVALAHMRKCSIIHADLKPDNILVNESRNVLKICDLGTAIDKSDAATAHMDITPYLVSRFYRAPEIILGIPYDYAVDMWSIGCTLYELYTGKILFAGDSNNQMLKAIMEIRGRLTPKLFKRGQLSAAHFDDKGQFVSIERDKVLGKTAVRTMAMVKPTRDLRTRLMAASGGMSDAETRDLNHFIDLLEHCLALNPDKRIKPSDALRHPFFTSKTGHVRR
ncbi:CMGC DYRK PRP4 kinase [Fusarium albosuccineum]|uniref:non-specific serine/threonine protein kinase n=1 Tax=Fusarium albosuccineum TaxID=1237068 RepID=A0A8H4LQC1_9HYPO|nr:CMGC DYRK PRP4 kinase [Fusarium albosuccineum]